MNEQMNEQMNIRTDEQKYENYIPLSINAGGITRGPLVLYRSTECLGYAEQA